MQRSTLSTAWAGFIDEFPWNWFGTHTFRYEKHPLAADKIWKAWLHKILSKVAQLADAEYQQRVWVEGEGTGSLMETLDTLFDDYLFEAFISDNEDEKVFPDDRLNELRALRDALNAYPHYDKPPHEVLTHDPDWTNIRRLAARVISSF